jgi:hypothetical protein
MFWLYTHKCPFHKAGTFHQFLHNTMHTYKSDFQVFPVETSQDWQEIPHDYWPLGFLFLVKCQVFLVWDDNFILSLREQLICPCSNDTEQLPKPVLHPQKTIPGEGTRNPCMSHSACLFGYNVVTFHGWGGICVCCLYYAPLHEGKTMLKSW